jgi:uncharacterized protein YodC (DUF2158 family)
MEQEFKLQDSVQLMNGYTPTMTISEINQETKKALCVWYDNQKRKMNQDWLPLNVLKLTPKPPTINLEDIIPKRSW